MTRSAKPKALSSAIGRRIAELRGGISAGTVAREARALGLKTWDHSTVSRIERGHRALSAEELLLLPAILTAVTDKHVRLSDLFVEPVQLTDRFTAKPAWLRKLLAGETVTIPGHTPVTVEEAWARARALDEAWRSRERGGRRG